MNRIAPMSKTKNIEEIGCQRLVPCDTVEVRLVEGINHDCCANWFEFHREGNQQSDVSALSCSNIRSFLHRWMIFGPSYSARLPASQILRRVVIITNYEIGVAAGEIMEIASTGYHSMPWCRKQNMKIRKCCRTAAGLDQLFSGMVAER